MTLVSDYKLSQKAEAGCADLAALTPMAERELSAFFQAVAQSFGREAAELSAEDWLRELLASDGMPASARGWRGITVQASARLASRGGDACRSTAKPTATESRIVPQSQIT